MPIQVPRLADHEADPQPRGPPRLRDLACAARAPLEADHVIGEQNPMLSDEWRQNFGVGPLKDWLFFARAVNQPQPLGSKA